MSTARSEHVTASTPKVAAGDALLTQAGKSHDGKILSDLREGCPSVNLSVHKKLFKKKKKLFIQDRFVITSRPVAINQSHDE